MNKDGSGRLWQFTTGGNCCELGQRFPAIYQEYNFGLHFTCGINKNGTAIYQQYNYGFTCGINNNGNHYGNFQGKANTWYTLEVSQTKNQYGKVTLINHEYKKCTLLSRDITKLLSMVNLSLMK